jgi:hypothetical protein
MLLLHSEYEDSLILKVLHKLEVVEQKGFFWGEWAVRAGLKINFKCFYLSTLTVGSCYRLP